MSQKVRKLEPRVWMNVTTSANWTRPPVGIVRVEQELFKALAVKLGERLVPCVLSDGHFFEYSGSIGSKHLVETEELEDFVWPDPSYDDFPRSVSLEPRRVASIGSPFKRRPQSVVRQRRAEIGFGDFLISVGLDWDWETHRLDSLLYDLKTHRDVKVITCCYDLIPVLFPQYCVGDVAAKFREYFTNITWSSSGMLCISERSESDYRALAVQLGMPQIPTKVMRLGNKLPEPGEDVSDHVASICEQRFILFVSTIERRKNHEVLYKALHILAEQGRLSDDLKLVFVGMPGWGVADLLKDIELDPIVSRHIIQLSHVNDAELCRLYEACQFFVYPSFYEGWGLPVAEALAFGKFVIASDRGSIPEVGGDLVEYVDPWNATAWSEAIDKYSNDPDLVRSRARRIQSEYYPIHWSETADAVTDLMATLGSARMSKIEVDPGYDMVAVAGVPYGPRLIAAGQGGLLCHGLYRPLPAGRHRLDVAITKLGGEPVTLEFKFTANRGTAVIQKEKRKITRTGVLKFELDLRTAIEHFEILVECAGEPDLALEHITIHLAKGLP